MAEFSNTLNSLNAGQVETELSLHLKGLIAAVRDTGKSGKITLTLAVEQDKKDARLIRLSTDLNVKMPEQPRPVNIYYVRGNTLIALEDTQQRLDFGAPNPEPQVIQFQAQGETA